MRIALKISGLYWVVSELAPLIITKPITTITMLMASMMKLILPNAKFFFSSILVVFNAKTQRHRVIIQRIIIWSALTGRNGKK